METSFAPARHRTGGLVARVLSARPELRSWQLTLFAAASLPLAYNDRFWSELFRLRAPLDSGDLLFAGSLLLVLVASLNLLLTLFAWSWIQKGATVVLILTSAIVVHFMSAYGVVIDSTMIQNTFETDPGEVSELINAALILRLLVWGVLPASLVLAVKVPRRTFGEALRANLVVAGASVAALLVMIGAMYPAYASFFPQHHELGHLVTPINVISGTERYLRRSAGVRPGPPEPRGLDAHLPAKIESSPRKTVLVLVVGETARSSEFSLNGYERPTNPMLAQEPVISFSDVHSCGTSTAVSLPCMFSELEHGNYRDRDARNREGMLDVLKHAGVRVLWRENNSGCKGACDRVPTEGAEAFADERFCAGGDCFDEALLSGLDRFLDRLDGHAVIVLHQKGSHGPAYHLRHPDAFRRFRPACEVSELQDCTHEQVVNAYDNTILYTDWVLAKVLDLLRRHDERFDTAMLYVSDHGESLGEGNLYLHGLPYAIAPDDQTRVPMIFWSSPEFQRDTGLDATCLQAGRDRPLSHDNLFHSVLGLMSVQTAVYDPSKDLFAACRS